MSILQKWLCLIPLISTLNARAQCLTVNKNNASAIHIAFHYSGRLKLPEESAKADSRFYQSLSRSMELPTHDFIDEDGSNKSNFVSALAAATEGKAYTMGSYSGHGILVPKVTAGGWDGKTFEWAMLLPAATTEDLLEALDRLKDDPKGKREIEFNRKQLGEFMPLLKNSVVTATEIETISARSGNIWFMDTCFAGKFADSVACRSEPNCVFYSCAAKETSGASYLRKYNESDAKFFVGSGPREKRISQFYRDLSEKFMGAPRGTALIELASDDRPSDPAILAEVKKEYPQYYEKALALQADFKADALAKDALRKADFVIGSAFTNYLSKSDPELIDTNHDGMVTIHEMRARLPKSFYVNYNTLQTPGVAISKSAACETSFVNSLKFPAALFGHNAEEGLPLETSKLPHAVGAETKTK